MARTAKLSFWNNKNDITVYYRGVKIFRGTMQECAEFERNFNTYLEAVAETKTIKFKDADGKEYDTGIEQPNDPDFDISITENEAKVLRAIATNCFNVLNYGIPTSYEEAHNDVWSDCIDDAKIPSGLAPRSIAGVCGSLARKKLIESSEWDDSDNVIRMTEAGFNAMMKFYNNNLEA